MTIGLVKLVLSAAAAALLTSCAMFQERCEQFEQRSKQADYGTRYQLQSGKLSTDVKPLAKYETAAARNYQIRLDTERTRPCSHVTIAKELVLLRRESPGITIEEIREFFAEGGKRIAVKTEILTDQLRQSGRYTAAVPLPIPKGAPPGKYRLTSSIAMKIKGSTKVVTLAKASASFEVAATK